MNNENNLECIIESILFAMGGSVSIKDLCRAIEKDEKSVKILIKNLQQKYENENRGIKIIEIENSFQMCTNPKYFSYIKNICSKESQRKVLTQVLLETLAIISYKQPITKSQIESIRGVNADHAVNTLMKYNLICEKGRLDVPGRPIIFGTTDDFLRYFGFKNIEELPNIGLFEQLKLDIEEY